MSSDLLNTIGTVLQTVVAVFGALLAAFWIALVIWTFRDMRARSRDLLATLLASLLVVLFGPVGLGLYLLLRPRDTLAEQYERMLEEEALLRDMEEQPVCSNCQHKTQPDWMLCPHCTTQLRRPCPSCGRLLDLNWQICPYCAQAPTAAPTTPEIAAPFPQMALPTMDDGRWAKPSTGSAQPSQLRPDQSLPR